MPVKAMPEVNIGQGFSEAVDSGLGLMDKRRRALLAQQAQDDALKAAAANALLDAKKEGYEVAEPEMFRESPWLKASRELEVKSKGFLPKYDEQGNIIGVGDVDPTYWKAKGEGSGMQGLLQQIQLQKGLLDLQKTKKEMTKAEQGKELPAAQVLSVSEGAAVSQMLPDLSQTIQANEDIFGPVRGRLGQANPYDERSQSVDAQMRAASQSFGRFMEGGVLRKEDEEKYRRMFPNLSDTPETARNKLAIVQRLLDKRYSQGIESLGAQGYSTQGLSGLTKSADVPKSITKGKSDLSLVPAASATTGERVINGVKYRKVEGGWQRVK